MLKTAAKYPALTVDARAVSEASRQGVDFFTSSNDGRDQQPDPLPSEPRTHQLSGPDAWGNIIAFRGEIDWVRLLNSLVATYPPHELDATRAEVAGMQTQWPECARA